MTYLNQIHHGDCIQVMQNIAPNSIDLILTDPPYLVNYRDRTGRSIAGDITSEWLEPAFKQMYRVLRPDSFAAEQSLATHVAAGARHQSVHT